MFLKDKQALLLQKAVCGWEIKWSNSHQYLPSFMSTCLSDMFVFFRMKKRAETLPEHGPALSMMLYVWRLFLHTASGMRTQLEGRQMLKN